MAVLGPAPHAVIKDLCDDFDKPERRVKFIYSLSAGVDAYRLSELTKELHGIPMHNAQGCYSSVLAEHVAFSMLYFNRYPRSRRCEPCRMTRSFSVLTAET
jgi:phosphoglycerate dehydrogenase-like enzyme